MGLAVGNQRRQHIMDHVGLEARLEPAQESAAPPDKARPAPDCENRPAAALLPGRIGRTTPIALHQQVGGFRMIVGMGDDGDDGALRGGETRASRDRSMSNSMSP